jgi:hypothetical protein
MKKSFLLGSIALLVNLSAYAGTPTLVCDYLRFEGPQSEPIAPSQKAVLESEDPSIGTNVRAILKLAQVVDGQELIFNGMVMKEWKSAGVTKDQLGVSIIDMTEKARGESGRHIAWVSHYVLGQPLTLLHDFKNASGDYSHIMISCKVDE